MMCQNCGNNEAEFHYNSNINGEISELHLCSECASKLKSGNKNAISQVNYLNSFLADLLSATKRKPIDSMKCPLCGATERSIMSTGKVGCAQCYDTFNDMLTPYIKRIHGNTVHCGKAPSSAGPELKLRREIESLRHELDTCIHAEEYEKAVLLRDRIKELEGGDKA